MIHLKIEQIGDTVAIVLDEEAQRLLGASVGDTVRFEQTGDAVVLSTNDAVTRGKLFVERYIKTFEALAK
jgi:phage gp45-like